MNKYKIKFKPSLNEFQPKLYLKCHNPKSTKIWIGKWENNQFIVDGIKTLGEFSLDYDLVPPTIKVLPRQKNSSYQNFKIEDNESGIGRYSLYFNSIWQIVYYDEKNDLLLFNIPKNFNRSTHDILLKVEDKMGNESTKSVEINY